MGKFKIILTGLFAALISISCGGGGGGGFTNSGNNTGDIGAAHNVSISVPSANAITQLSGDQSGFYQLIATATVTDKNGNAVKDDTVVQLDVIDSVIARGVIGAADSLTGSTLNDANPNFSDDATAGTLSTVYIQNKGENRYIEEGDLVLLRSNAELQDQVRYASGTPTTASLGVSSEYSRDYPNATYAAGTTSYLIGTSRIGASVYGVDSLGNETRGIGKTKDGLISMRVKFPANNNTIHVGCSSNPNSDTRYNTPQAGYADTYLVARVGNTDVATVSTDFCFNSILPHAITANPPGPIGADGNVVLTVKDAGNIGIPFTAVSASAVATAGTLSATGCTTGVGGTCTSAITCTAATGTVTYSTGSGASVAVTVTSCP